MIESVCRGSTSSTKLLRTLKTLVVLALISLPFAAPGISHATEQPAQVSEADSSSDDELLDSLEEDYEAEQDPTVQVLDPFEEANRLTFGFNQIIDKAILKPVVLTYRFITPEPIRVGIANVVNNTYAPITIVNAALQGDNQKAGDTTVRFLLNTTLGFGGLLDVATMAGLPQHYEDFGQTLAMNGVPPGPYVVVPVIGPATPRHLVGRTVDYLTNPLSWFLWDTSLLVSSSPTMATLVTQRDANLEAIDNLEENSPDFYASAKSAYAQNRQAAIKDGNESAEPEAKQQTKQAGFKIRKVSFRLDEATKDNELSR